MGTGAPGRPERGAGRDNHEFCKKTGVRTARFLQKHKKADLRRKLFRLRELAGRSRISHPARLRRLRGFPGGLPGIRGKEKSGVLGEINRRTVAYTPLSSLLRARTGAFYHYTLTLVYCPRYYSHSHRLSRRRMRLILAASRLQHAQLCRSCISARSASAPYPSNPGSSSSARGRTTPQEAPSLRKRLRRYCRRSLRWYPHRPPR